jgi:peptidoglycan/xylan/chitin deacetylase (PgdA/CDA1 family)
MGLRPRAVILLYHRIASPAMDPLLLSVSSGNFTDHLAILRRDYHPITLVELAEACAANRIPDRAVAITFDDGYTDNLRAAAPILERSRQQATVFVTGACLEGVPLFDDELERILLWTPKLPDRIRIRVNGRAREWDLGEWSRRPKNPDGDYLRWNMEWPSDPTPRHRCYRDLFDILRAAPVRVRVQTMASLRKAALPEQSRPPHRLLMTQAELRKAAAGNILEIGAHTQHHPALNRLTASEQREEIVSGKRLLERAIGREVRAFAYPYGSPWDVAPETVQLAREAGFAVACGNYPGPMDSESDLFWLPRCLVRDWSGEEFERRLREFFRPQAEIPPRG